METESFADVWKEVDDFQRSLYFWERGFFKRASKTKRLCLKNRAKYDIQRVHHIERAEQYGCDLELKRVMYQRVNNEY